MPIDASLVTLREITSETVIPVVRLAVAENQKGFVAPNAVSLAQARFAPEAWYRAIYLGDEMVGFVMLEDESLRSPPPEKPSVGVWRFMIDARFQGRGIGRAALLRVIEHVRAKGLFETLELSYVPGPGCPEPFYLALGFRHTGTVDEGEVVLELPLRLNSSMEASQMSRVSTYLNFPRCTEQAFAFYRSVFGGDFAGPIHRFSDIPAAPDQPPLAEADRSLVMHVELPILGGHVLMGTDAPESMGFSLTPGNNVYINLEPDTRAETDRLFHALSASGKVEMPLQEMFWGGYFGSITDQFGIRWMFNCSSRT